nr:MULTISPECIES: VOC family protein [Kribbella]
MTSFYSELFGWQLQPAGPEYSLVPAGEDGVGIGGGLLQTVGEMPPYVTVYVAVDDLAAMLGRAGELGGKTVVEPTTIPGVGQFAMFADPDGNIIGLLHQVAETPSAEAAR